MPMDKSTRVALAVTIAFGVAQIGFGMTGVGTPVVGWSLVALSIVSAGVLIALLLRQSRRPVPKGLPSRGTLLGVWRSPWIIYSFVVVGALALILGVSADAWQLALPGTQLTFSAVVLLFLGGVLRHFDDLLRLTSKGRVYFPEDNPLDFMCKK